MNKVLKMVNNFPNGYYKDISRSILGWFTYTSLHVAVHILACISACLHTSMYHCMYWCVYCRVYRHKYICVYFCLMKITRSSTCAYTHSSTHRYLHATVHAVVHIQVHSAVHACWYTQACVSLRVKYCRWINLMFRIWFDIILKKSLVLHQPFPLLNIVTFCKGRQGKKISTFH